MNNNMIEKRVSLEDKVSVYMDKFDTLLKDPNRDQTKLLDEILKVVILIMRTSAKIDKNYALDREVEIFARVQDVKGTFNSKLVLGITVTVGVILILGGITTGASAIPGTSFGNSLANTKFSFLSGGADEARRIQAIGSAITQIGQGVGVFPKVAEEASQGERTVQQYRLEEEKQKRQDRNDSKQRSTQHHERALQQARENAEKESRAKSDMMRGTAA